MKQTLFYLFVLVVMVLGILAMNEQDRKIATLRARADSLIVVADSSAREAGRQQDRADSLDRRATRLAADARQRRTQDRTVPRLVAAIAQAPDTCRELAQRAAEALTAVEQSRNEWEVAYVAQKAATDSLRAANSTLRIAYSTARSADTVRGAALDVATRQRRGLARLLPHAGVGVAVGIDANGRPNAVSGIFVGWRF